MKKLFVISLLLSSFLLGCGKDVEETPMLKLSTTERTLNVDANGGSESISFDTNEAWEASSTETWCAVNPSSGEAGKNVTVSAVCAKNTNHDSRACIVTISTKDLSQSVNIFQENSKYISIRESEYVVTNDSQEIIVGIEANIDFNVTINSSCSEWLKLVKSTSSSVILSVSKNTSYDSREGTAILSSSDGSITESVRIRQRQTDAMIPLTTEVNMPQEGGPINLEVQSNVDYVVVVSSDWIQFVTSRGLVSDNLAFSVAPNETYDKRSAKITLTSKDGTLIETVTVNQARRNVLSVKQTEYDVEQSGETVVVEVQSNVDYVTKTDSDWVTLISTKGIASGNLTFKVAPNETYDNRSAKITLTSDDGSLTATVTINQAQKNGLTVKQTEYEVAQKGGVIELQVESNVECSARVNSDWVKEVSTKSLSPNTLTFNVEPNESYDSRNAEITISTEDKSLSQIVTIIQAQKDYLSVSGTEYEVEESGGSIEIKLETNTEITAEISSDWVTEVTTKSLATSSRTFKIAAMNDGTAQRTASIVFRNASSTVSKTVTITQKSALSLDVTSFSILIGDTRTITATVHLADKNVVWKSSNPAVASVSNGTVTALTKGTATITASAGEGRYAKACEVTVVDITNYVSARYRGCSASIINGLYQHGSALFFGINNGSPKTITVKSLQLYDGVRKTYGNVMSINAVIEPGGNAAWSVTVGLLGIYDPYAIFVYEYSGTEYTAICSVNGSFVIPYSVSAAPDGSKTTPQQRSPTLSGMSVGRVDSGNYSNSLYLQ